MAEFIDPAIVPNPFLQEKKYPVWVWEPLVLTV